MKLLSKIFLAAATAFAVGNCVSYQPKPMSGRLKQATVDRLNKREAKVQARCTATYNKKLAVLYKKCANEYVREAEAATYLTEMEECKAKATEKKIEVFDALEISPMLVNSVPNVPAIP